MRVIDRLDLLDRIGRELQSRMTFSQIEAYLIQHGVMCKGFTPSSNSKWVYVREVMADANEKLLLSIADELEIDHGFSSASPREATFWRAGHFKLFLSHLASFKVNATILQNALKQYAITSFVAHEDIEPTREWQMEIELALHTMDALVALLMPGFRESNWCDQEVGVAVGRNMLVIPVRKGLDPYGFIGKYQGIQGNNKTVRGVAKEIYETLATSPKTRAKMLRAVSILISTSASPAEALAALPLFESFKEIPSDVLENLKIDVSENRVLTTNPNFIYAFNCFLASKGIQLLSVGTKLSPSWDDDIPF